MLDFRSQMIGMFECRLRIGGAVDGDLLMIILCLYACVVGSASMCLSVRCE